MSEVKRVKRVILPDGARIAIEGVNHLVEHRGNKHWELSWPAEMVVDGDWIIARHTDDRHIEHMRFKIENLTGIEWK